MIKGVVGTIRWGYYTAAAINGYTAVRTRGPRGDTWSLRATVVLADAFKMAQRPLTFVAPFDKGEWRFPILDYTQNLYTLTATLGTPQEIPKA